MTPSPSPSPRNRAWDANYMYIVYSNYIVHVLGLVGR